MSADKKAIGVRLRAVREDTPFWSRGKLARLLRAAADPRERDDVAHVASLTEMIKQWERGDYIPSRRYRDLYCRVTGKTWDELVDPDGDVTPSASGATDLSGTDLAARISAVTGRRVGAGMVADLAARVHGLRLADDVLAGHDLLVPAFRELDNAERIYSQATHTDETGRRLLSVIGEFAQIAGWVASDAGENERAADTYRRGIDAAREAGDAPLLSNLIGSLAYQTANVGSLQEANALAQASLEAAGPTSPPRARALAWDRIAWVNARTQDAQATMRALGEASAALAEDGDIDNEPDYLYWVDTGELQIMEARAYTELRRPLRAVPLLVDVLSRYDTTHARELALYLSWLAVALADANEPEEAAAAAARMLELSGDVASDRTAQRARVVLAKLDRYRDVPAVRDVLDSVAP